MEWDFGILFPLLSKNLSHHHPIAGSIDARNIKWSWFLGTWEAARWAARAHQDGHRSSQLRQNLRPCFSQKRWVMKDSLLSCLKPYLVSPSKSGSSFWRWTDVSLGVLSQSWRCGVAHQSCPLSSHHSGLHNMQFQCVPVMIWHLSPWD